MKLSKVIVDTNIVSYIMRGSREAMIYRPFLEAERERKGLPISCADTWIAACAVCYGIPLVTHNTADFDEISNLQVISGG